MTDIIKVPQYTYPTSDGVRQGEFLTQWYREIARANGLTVKPAVFSLAMLVEARAVAKTQELPFVNESIFDRPRYLRRRRVPLALGVHPYGDLGIESVPPHMILHELPEPVAKGRKAYMITRQDVQVLYNGQLVDWQFGEAPVLQA